MKTITQFQCEFCNCIMATKESMRRHEAKHSGVSYEVYTEWMNLNNCALRESRELEYEYNDKNRNSYNQVINDLIEFEDKHGLTGKKKPINF